MSLTDLIFDSCSYRIVVDRCSHLFLDLGFGFFKILTGAMGGEGGA